jgi:MYXO-CTERM domain-containing protein
VPDCCAIDADCDDANPCTVDTCPAPGGACQNVPADGCCLHDTDCDDGDACTRDTCSFPGGACQNEAIAHCCRSRDDCPAGAACQGGLCVTGGVLDGGWGDAGTTGGADGGCGCRTTAPATAPGALGALLLLGLLAGRRRRP